MFPHPPRRGESGTSAQISGSRWRPWHRARAGPAAVEIPRSLRGRRRLRPPLSSPPQLGTCPRFIPPPPPSLLGNLPSLSKGHPSSQLGKLRQEVKQSGLSPRGQWHPAPQTWVNPPTCSQGVTQGPLTWLRPPCVGRAGQEWHPVPSLSEPGPSLEALPAPGMNQTFPRGQIAAPPLQGPDLARLDPRALGKQSQPGHSAGSAARHRRA